MTGRGALSAAADGLAAYAASRASTGPSTDTDREYLETVHADLAALYADAQRSSAGARTPEVRALGAAVILVARGATGVIPPARAAASAAESLRQVSADTTQREVP
jgi:hypothetical protein